MSSRFALIDGNSFYASCQMAFDPSLANRPVVVLSNNDGCIVAANARAKQLNEELIQSVGDLGRGGYAAAVTDNMMFQPYFKVKWLLERYQTAVFSSNYELYGDMSQRMHAIIGEFSPQQEIYSIDESFLRLDSLPDQNWLLWGQNLKQTVRQQIGIPVAVGIGPTKTLAKLANHLAKKEERFNGVFAIENLHDAEFVSYLQAMPIQKVWGIGKRLAERLRADGLETVYQFQKASPAAIRKAYGVTLERTFRELNGEVCFQFQEAPGDKKQIINSRSFGQPVTDLKTMERAVISHLSRALEKLRRQNSLCQAVTVFIRSNPFKENRPFYSHHKTLVLLEPSDNSLFLAKKLREALASIWRPGVEFHKAGVILGEILPKGAYQPDLFWQNGDSENSRQQALVKLMDQVNRSQGKETLFVASAGSRRRNGWQMLRNRMSPRYSTQWHELPKASAK